MTLEEDVRSLERVVETMRGILQFSKNPEPRFLPFEHRLEVRASPVTFDYGITVTGMDAVGVKGHTAGGDGVNGVEGFSPRGDGVSGASEAANRSGVFGFNFGSGVGVAGASATGIGVQGAGNPAGNFIGDVSLTGRIICQDCLLRDIAEDFELSSDDQGISDPGTVMVLKDGGLLEACSQSYDKKVAGILSGAGDLKPGFLLGFDKSRTNKVPLALTGTVFCKVDASASSIEVGDLLTTSNTPGHAMKASDPIKAFGTVIGKALKPLREGRGLIPVLVALQ